MRGWKGGQPGHISNSLGEEASPCVRECVAGALNPPSIRLFHREDAVAVLEAKMEESMSNPVKHATKKSLMKARADLNRSVCVRV